MRTKIISTSIKLSKNQRIQLLKPFKLISQQANYPALILSLQFPKSSGTWNYSFVTGLTNPKILEYGTIIFKLDGAEKNIKSFNGRDFSPNLKRRRRKKNNIQPESHQNKILKEVRPLKLTSYEILAKMERL